jgi:hypothetical protein
MEPKSRPEKVFDKTFSKEQKIFQTGSWIKFKGINVNNHNERKLLFGLLKLCQCCERHQEKKPSSMELGWDESEWQNTQLGQPGHECSCNCRNKMRCLARQYNI